MNSTLRLLGSSQRTEDENLFWIVLDILMVRHLTSVLNSLRITLIQMVMGKEIRQRLSKHAYNQQVTFQTQTTAAPTIRTKPYQEVVVVVKLITMKITMAFATWIQTLMMTICLMILAQI